MTTTRLFLLFPLFTLVGVMACSGNNTGGSQATTGGAPGTGGTTASGGAATTGGAPTSGGSPTSGGITSTGGTSTSGGTTAKGGTPASGGTTATGGTTTSGGTTAKGGSVGSGGTVSSGGSTAAGGAVGGTTRSGGAGGAGGKTGSGGSSAGGSSTGLTLDQSCSAMCASQASGACPVADCQTACVNAADATVSAVTKCNTQYTAMAQCEANLGGNQWTCSSDENVPIPVEGQCTDTVCAWACCATDLIVPSDIWARCMDTCSPSGTGGTSGAGGNSGVGGSTSTGGTTGKTGGTSASGGSSGSGGKTGAGGSGATGGAGGAGGAPPTTGIPAGYPNATPDNYAKCQKVAVGTNDACGGQPNGNICIECLFGGTDYNSSETTPTATATSEAGNYVVTVTLGGSAAGDTYVSAESTRGLLRSVTTTAGQSLTYAFVVNVRAMEGQPQHAGGPGGYPGLDLFFSGTNPQVSAIGYALADATTTKPIMVYIASDSTTCDQTGGAYGGWGQMLPEYFGPPVGIANYANSGASSSSFYGSSNFWGAIKSKWTKGDWAIIQFGHNDKTATDAAVQTNLEKYVTDAQAAGVNAILVSPPARAGSYPIGAQTLHEASAQGAATAKGVPFINLTQLSIAWYNTLGSKAAVMAYHANGSDATHTNLPGGEKLAGLVAKAIKDQNIGLAPYLRQ